MAKVKGRNFAQKRSILTLVMIVTGMQCPGLAELKYSNPETLLERKLEVTLICSRVKRSKRVRGQAV
jgi:hypothetical protein